MSERCLSSELAAVTSAHVPLANSSCMTSPNIRGSGKCILLNAPLHLQGLVEGGRRVGQEELGTNSICCLNPADSGSSCRISEHLGPRCLWWGPQVLLTPSL